MRRQSAKWGGGIGRWWELLRPTWPRSRIPPEGRQWWGPLPPYRLLLSLPRRLIAGELRELAASGADQRTAYPG